MTPVLGVGGKQIQNSPPSLVMQREASLGCTRPCENRTTNKTHLLIIAGLWAGCVCVWVSRLGVFWSGDEWRSVADACWTVVMEVPRSGFHTSLQCASPRWPVHCLRASCREAGPRSEQRRASLHVPLPSRSGYPLLSQLGTMGAYRVSKAECWDESTI